MPIRAFIFDCNGLLCDDEPIHFRSLQRSLAEEGISIDQRAYLERYISYDDRGAVRQALSDHSRPTPPEDVDRIVLRKRQYYNEMVDRDLRMFPGTVSFVRAASARFATAIASGAIRPEIDRILSRAGIADCFRVIVSAEDVSRCKPSPDSYLLALERLNGRPEFVSRALAAADCLAFEDSRGGVQAARDAGMHVVAVANTHTPDELAHAHRVITTLESMSPESVASEWID